MVRSRSVPVVGLALLAFAGCGGGGGSSSKLSKTAFDAKLNAICKKYNAQGNKLGNPQKLSDLPAYIDKAASLFDKELGELKGMQGQAPASISGDFAQALSILRKQRSKLDDLKAAAKANDTKKAQQIVAGSQADNSKADAIATRIGAPECAKSS